MFGREKTSQGAALPERIARHLQVTGQRIAGDRGGRAANKISEAIGCGRIDFCNQPDCPDCN